MYCDMETDDGGWTLVGVALVAYAGEAGWNDDDGLNLALSYRQLLFILVVFQLVVAFSTNGTRWSLLLHGECL